MCMVQNPISLILSPDAHNVAYWTSIFEPGPPKIHICDIPLDIIADIRLNQAAPNVCFGYIHEASRMLMSSESYQANAKNTNIGDPLKGCR